MDRMAQTALNSMKNLMENQMATAHNLSNLSTPGFRQDVITDFSALYLNRNKGLEPCLLYTSPSPRDRQKSRMPSSA